MKNVIYVLLAIVAMAAILYGVYYFSTQSLGSSSSPSPSSSPVAAMPSEPMPTPIESINPGTSPANATYLVEGQPVQLLNGKAEQPIADSASMVVTEMFGTPTMGDLNGDGLADAAVVLTQQPGGSGTFFYMAAALAQADGMYMGTNAILVGDRISPQTTSITDQTITFNYATRAAGEPMTAPATQAESAYYQVTDGELMQLPAAPTKP